jgi:hypothetical protein
MNDFFATLTGFEKDPSRRKNLGQSYFVTSLNDRIFSILLLQNRSWSYSFGSNAVCSISASAS